jgi:hypothetical protein
MVNEATIERAHDSAPELCGGNAWQSSVTRLRQGRVPVPDHRGRRRDRPPHHRRPQRQQLPVLARRHLGTGAADDNELIIIDIGRDLF